VLYSDAASNSNAGGGLQNGGFEKAGESAKKALGWHDFGLGYKRVKRAHSGERGIRLRNKEDDQQSGAYQRVDLNQTEMKPVMIDGYVKGRKIKNSDDGFIGASLYAEIYLQDGTVVYWNSIRNLGSFSWRYIGFNTGSLPAVNQPIDYIFVVPILANAEGTAWFDDIAVREYSPVQGAVTLMFDDGEITTYSEAKPVLDNYGMVGSAAVVVGLINKDEGYMSWPQVAELQAQGWEFVSHTMTHSDLTNMRLKDARREMARSRRKLARKGLTVKNLALPFGAYNADILARSTRFYRSVRAFEQGANPQGTFPFDVKVRGVTASTTPAQVAGWLDQAADKRQWLVLVWHTIADEGDDAYHTRPDVFADMVDVVAASGVEVVTYDEGLDRFGI